MERMFRGATSFDQPLNNWNVSKVTNISGIDSLDMAVMGRGLSHALGDQPMSMSIDDIGFSERG